jgi:type VI protein secretion system component VasF
MNKPFGHVVFPVFSAALELKDRLDQGEAPELEVEQRKLLDLLRTDGETRRGTDYVGDGNAFLGARYALACWIDELFIVHTPAPWSDQWKEKVLEMTLFGTRERAWKFWDQVDLVLKRPNTPRIAIPPGLDALEAFFLAVVLGFRGKFLDNPAKVREYLEEIRPQVSRTGAWPMPRDHGVTTNAEPLVGRETLRRVVSVYGGLTVLVILVLLILAKITLS